MKLVWTVGALQSLRGIRQYIAADNQAAACKVADRIERTVARLGAFPHSSRAGVRPGTLEIVIPGTPFVVVYRVTSTEVQIFRVFHGTQQRH